MYLGVGARARFGREPRGHVPACRHPHCKAGAAVHTGQGWGGGGGPSGGRSHQAPGVERGADME